MKKNNYNEISRSFAMITHLGISMLAPVILCAVLGLWLEERFHISVTAVLLILGILAGARNTWILLKQFQSPDKNGRRDDEKKNK